MYMRRMFWTLRLNEGRRIKEKLNSIPERAFLVLPPPLVISSVKSKRGNKSTNDCSPPSKGLQSFNGTTTTDTSISLKADANGDNFHGFAQIPNPSLVSFEIVSLPFSPLSNSPSPSQSYPFSLPVIPRGSHQLHETPLRHFVPGGVFTVTRAATGGGPGRERKKEEREPLTGDEREQEEES